MDERLLRRVEERLLRDGIAADDAARARGALEEEEKRHGAALRQAVEAWLDAGADRPAFLKPLTLDDLRQ